MGPDAGDGEFVGIDARATSATSSNVTASMRAIASSGSIDSPKITDWLAA